MFVLGKYLGAPGWGRGVAEILEDSYVHAWSTPEERARLLQRPTLVEALGENAIADLRAAIARTST